MAVKIIDNCCSPMYLDCLKEIATNSDNWNFQYPIGREIEDKFPKLDVAGNRTDHPFLAGLAMGLLIQIHEAGGQDLFIPKMLTCGISIKDKHRVDNIHTDNKKEDNFVKILGLLNSDWKEEWGGGFFHNGTSNYIKPTSFCIFDSVEEHLTEEIFTDKKRFAIDFTVCRDQQSFNKVLENATIIKMK